MATDKTDEARKDEPLAVRIADADAAEMAAREEGARVASIPNDNPTVSPGVWGDEIGPGLAEAGLYPPSTIHPPRYGEAYAEPFDWDRTPEHHHAAMITGEFQAGHRYPHGGAVHHKAQDHRDRLATGSTARQADELDEARKRNRELEHESEREEANSGDKRGAHERLDDKAKA